MCSGWRSYGVILWELITGEAPKRGQMRPLRHALPACAISAPALSECPTKDAGCFVVSEEDAAQSIIQQLRPLAASAAMLLQNEPCTRVRTLSCNP